MDPEKPVILSLENESEILRLLEELLHPDGYDPGRVTKKENLLDIIVKKDVHIIIGNLGSQPVSEEEFLNEVIDRNPKLAGDLASGRLDIRFGGSNEEKKDGTLYFSRYLDLSGIKKSLKKNDSRCVRIFEEN